MTPNQTWSPTSRRYLKRKYLKKAATSMKVINPDAQDEVVINSASDAKSGGCLLPLSGRRNTERGEWRPAHRIGPTRYSQTQHGRRMEVSQEAKVHVGGGNVVSYRWVLRDYSSPAHDGTMLEATKALKLSREATGLHVNNDGGFLLIVLPDLFMTVDSMERWLGGILDQNPLGRILLVSATKSWVSVVPMNRACGERGSKS